MCQLLPPPKRYPREDPPPGAAWTLVEGRSTVDTSRNLPVDFSWLRGCSRFRRRWTVCRLDLAWGSLGIVCARFRSLSTPKQIAQ
ncbi:hypothetical protein SADUNF_Sadunf10G0118400 [Salix dunnii]|uniref:Uncharacterized protein n=1 Tax=Salix dunnii TaxID=1413687 RepID=A0A835JQZ6_9ROSI|nr:hypothetical protein SADUNF_Sadunf10G0118400 [Salix dunnii]